MIEEEEALDVVAQGLEDRSVKFTSSNAHLSRMNTLAKVILKSEVVKESCLELTVNGDPIYLL